MNFAEMANRVPPRTAFASLPEIEALRADLAEKPTTLLSAETLAYFTVLTEFVIRNKDSRTELETTRSHFYNLQRRKVAFEDPISAELSSDIAPSHIVRVAAHLKTAV